MTIDAHLYALFSVLGILGAIMAIVMTEMAVTGLPVARVQTALELRKPGARLVMLLLQQPGRLHLALRFLYLMLALIGVSVVETQWLMHQDGFQNTRWLYWCATLATFLFADIAARYLGRRYALGWLCLIAQFLQALTTFLTPILMLADLLGQTFARMLGLQEPIPPILWGADELNRISHAAHLAHFDKPDEDLFLSLREFSDTVIREVMVPRTDMATLPIQSTREEVYALVLDVGHSRIPIYDDTIDNILGVLHVKDLFVETLENHNQQKPLDIRAHLRATFFVPEVMKISELLRDFQKRKTHMAIVVDEYGGTAGVITLEDILEEIVGEIQDEYDVDDKQFRILSENKIIADARVNIWDLEQALGVSFGSDGEYETLAGFLMSYVGSLPVKGTVISWNGLRFIIKEANEKRIGMVEIERRPSKPIAKDE